MQAVRYARPTTLAEAVRLLYEGGPLARILAGGTDVIVQARERRRQLNLFVDIKHVPEAMALILDDGGLTVGAGVPCYRLYEDHELARRYAAIAEAAHSIGGTAIQGRATLGGNLCNASPAADSIPSMIVLRGVARIAGPAGEREVPVAEFCTGPGQSVLAPGELLTALQFPPLPARAGSAWERFIPRNEMDIAVVNAAAFVRLEGDTVAEARVALGAVAPTPLLVAPAAEALVGRPLTDGTVADAMAAARAAAVPIEDVRGSIRQRRHLAGVLAERVIRRAAARAAAA